MIENESQLAVMDPDTASVGSVRDEPTHDVEDANTETDDESSEGLTTGALIGALRELGFFVSALGVASLTLPGIMGMFVLIGIVGNLDVITMTIQTWTQLQPETAAMWLGGAAVVYAILMAVCTGSIVLPTYATATIAGALFGLGTGSVVAMVGVTGGGLIGYAIGAAFARGRVMEVIQRHERASIIHRAITQRSGLQEGGVVALIRIPPNSPFALTNLLLSSTSVSLVSYAIGTAVGIAPRTLIAVWVGANLKHAAEEGGSPLWTVGKIAIGLVIFFVVYRILAKWAKEALAAQLAEEQADAAMTPNTTQTP